MDLRQSIRSYFEKLNLNHEIADIYLALYTHGPQTISQLTRTSAVERTRIYRLIDELHVSNLIEIQLKYKRRIFHAAPITNLHILISKKEQELKYLQTELNTLERFLPQTDLTSPTTRVQFYQGVDGAKQMFWNQTKAQTEILSILHEPMQHKTKSSFFERWVDAVNRRNLEHRSIVDDAFLESLKNWRLRHQSGKTKVWHARCISKNLFTIPNSTVIYDNVAAYYNWKDDEIFGVEIHNADITSTQRQLFEILWKQANPLD